MQAEHWLTNIWLEMVGQPAFVATQAVQMWTQQA